VPALLSSAAQQVDVGNLALGFLPDADYADAFQASATGDRPARDWAKRTLGSGTSALDRTFGTLVWHGILGFDLAPADTPETLVGWAVPVDSPELFVLAADGRLMAGCMVFEVSAQNVLWTTLLRFHRPPAERIWSVAQHVHRALAGRVLARAAGSLPP
jgi:hypothetical protein